MSRVFDLTMWRRRRFFLQRLRSGKDQLAAAVAAHRLEIPVSWLDETRWRNRCSGNLRQLPSQVANCDRDFGVTEARLLARLDKAILKAGEIEEICCNWQYTVYIQSYTVCISILYTIAPVMYSTFHAIHASTENARLSRCTWSSWFAELDRSSGRGNCNAETWWVDFYPNCIPYFK